MIDSFSSSKVLTHYNKLQNIIENTPGYPITFTIDPTNRCNQDCDFCLNANQRKTNNSELPLGKIIDILKLAKKIGVKGIKIAGGEPLSYSRIHELLDVLKEYDFEYGLTTNGTLMTPDISDKINGLFKYISISAETFNFLKYSQIRKSSKVNELKENIKYFNSLKSETNINLNLLIHQMTYMDIFETVSTAKELGMNTVFIKPIAFTQNYPYNYIITPRVIKSQIVKAKSLEDDNFKVVVSTDRTDTNYKAQHNYPECQAVYLGGVWGADGYFHLCCDRRNDKLHLFNFMFEEVCNFTEYWGKPEHLKMVKKIIPKKHCPRCTFNSFNIIIDDLKNKDILRHLI